MFVEGLVEERFRPVCAPSVAAAGSLDAAELLRFRLIHSVKSQAQWPRWFDSAGVNATERWRRVLFDRTHMAIDAAAAGFGIALESDLMMWAELKSGRLACPVRNPPALSLTTQWVTCPPEHLRLGKVKTFLAWLKHEQEIWRTERDQTL